MMMRLLAVTGVLAAGFSTATAAADPTPNPAGPAARPVPASVWISPGEIPMNGEYHWSAANPTATGRASFLSMRLCGTTSADVLPPASAIATQAASGTAASVVQAAGQWPEGNTDGALAFQSAIRSQLNYCPGVGDVISVDLRPAPSWYGFAATLLVGKERDNPTSEVHIYNVVPPESGTVSELAVTVPRTGREPSPWKPVDDATVLRALAQPLCKGSC
ncbi:hypothetical protein [Mycobacteroides salmoniphilum]|nr:hypothetical protein [Mycobacteroides salmoniphilum]